MLQFAPLLLLLGGALPQGDAPRAATAQIHWQRNVADALALARRSGRPLLIAVNMDGESASESLARARYRDPGFVAWTRAFVCVVASPDRHSPRDTDERGRRIECPRFGCVTCGEHQAIEPALFERFLGGERVAPRHAAVRVDGEKLFDLFLLYDLRALDRALEKAAGELGGPLAEALPEDPGELAADPRHRAKARLEARFESADAAGKLAILTALGAHADAATADADLLRMGILDPDESVRALALAVGTRLCPAALEPLVRDQLVWSEETGERRAQLETWAALAPSGRAAERLLASLALAAAPAVANRAREVAAERFAPLSARLAAAGAARDLLAALAEHAPFTAVATAPWSAVPAAPACEMLIERVQGLYERRPDDPWLQLEMGRAFLLHAERVILDGGDPSLFLADAQDFLGQAQERLEGAERAAAALLGARCAWLRSDFELARTQARAAMAGEGRAAAARLQLELVARDMMAERERETSEAFVDRFALAVAALAVLAEEDGLGEAEWIQAGDLMSLCGRWRDQAWIYELGLQRHPGSVNLHQRLRDLLSAAGRVGDLLAACERLEREGAGEDATAAWFHGFARVLAAEAARRRLEFLRAQSFYAQAQSLFRQSRELNAAFAASVEEWEARIALGEAHCAVGLQAGDAAAQLLIQVAASKLEPARSSDGLGRDLQDLIDGVVELRGMEPRAIGAGLVACDPIPLKVLDGVALASLREAYRARGRGEEELAASFFAEALALLRLLQEHDSSFARQKDLARALLEVARATDGEPTARRELLEEAEALLERSWMDEAMPALIDAWLKRLGPSRSFMRRGR